MWGSAWQNPSVAHIQTWRGIVRGALKAFREPPDGGQLSVVTAPFRHYDARVILQPGAMGEIQATAVGIDQPVPASSTMTALAAWPQTFCRYWQSF